MNKHNLKYEGMRGGKSIQNCTHICVYFLLLSSIFKQKYGFWDASPGSRVLTTNMQVQAVSKTRFQYQEQTQEDSEQSRDVINLKTDRTSGWCKSCFLATPLRGFEFSLAREGNRENREKSLRWIPAPEAVSQVVGSKKPQNIPGGLVTEQKTARGREIFLGKSCHS